MYFFRRYRFIITRPYLYQRFSGMRKGLSPDGYTLKPFDDNQCIFIHIPKNAGQSVRNTLFENLLPGHMKAYTYQLIFPKRIFENYYKFAFVRNPWDRLASAYMFMKGGGAHEKDRLWSERTLTKYDSFESFVKNGLRNQEIQDWPHFRPQVDFLRGQNGMIELDFIGRFENLQQDFNHVRDHLGLSGELLFINKTKIKREPYQTYYSDESREITARVYKEDIEVFNYKF
ncbi:MAG: hypothetical protein DRJ13_07130 [Bacteroidetes bacterium]|nr:MAG: hypothetical protein DRJ13_07130 [Bacteroidota bacterium]